MSTCNVLNPTLIPCRLTMAHISNIASWEISYTLNGGFKWENRLQSVFFHCCVRLPDAISPINQKKVLSSDYGRS